MHACNDAQHDTRSTRERAGFYLPLSIWTTRYNKLFVHDAPPMNPRDHETTKILKKYLLHRAWQHSTPTVESRDSSRQIFGILHLTIMWGRWLCPRSLSLFENICTKARKWRNRVDIPSPQHVDPRILQENTYGTHVHQWRVLESLWLNVPLIGVFFSAASKDTYSTYSIERVSRMHSR